MDCYRVLIPDGVKVLGVTATGYPSALLPGEYLAHRLRPKDPDTTQALVRFVGADALGRDVHVPQTSVQKFLDQGTLIQPADAPGEGHETSATGTSVAESVGEPRHLAVLPDCAQQPRTGDI